MARQRRQKRIDQAAGDEEKVGETFLRKGIQYEVRTQCHRNSAKDKSSRPFHLAAAYDTGLRLAASLRVAKRKYVVFDKLAVQVTVRIDDQHGFVVFARQLADQGSWVLSPLPDKV
jgi:hypothetical protein